LNDVEDGLSDPDEPMESQKLELRWSWQCEQGRSRRRNEYGSFL